MATNHRDLVTDSTQAEYQQLTDAPIKAENKKPKKSKATDATLKKTMPEENARISSVEDLMDDKASTCCFGFFKRKKVTEDAVKSASNAPTVNQLRIQNGRIM